MSYYAFQYASENEIFEDRFFLTKDEAYELWDKNIDNFKAELARNNHPEMAIWSGMKTDSDYHTMEKYLHGDDVRIIDGEFYQVDKI